MTILAKRFRHILSTVVLLVASIAGITLGAIALLTSEATPNLQIYQIDNVSNSGIHYHSCLVWWATDDVEATGRILACDKD